MVLQVVMFSLREFHNLAPYMEMHIDFALERKRVMQNESFCLVLYTDIYGLKKNQFQVYIYIIQILASGH